MGIAEERQPMRGSTAYTRWLGAELRELRGGQAVAVVAGRLGWDAARLSEVERGKRVVSEAELGALLLAHQVDTATYDRLIGMAGEANPGGFACAHADRPADGIPPLVVHERLAKSIWHYSPLLVPAPLQSEGYARAVLHSRGLSPRAAEAALTARVERCARWQDRKVELFVGEWALTPRGGDLSVLAGQVRLVADAGVRVVTVRAGGSLVVDQAFSILTLKGRRRPVVCVEAGLVTFFVEDDAGVAGYTRQRGLVEAAALSEQESRRFLDRLSDWYEHGGTAPWPGTAVLR